MVLREEALKYDEALKYCRTTISQFKTEERRVQIRTIMVRTMMEMCSYMA